MNNYKNEETITDAECTLLLTIKKLYHPVSASLEVDRQNGLFFIEWKDLLNKSRRITMPLAPNLYFFGLDSGKIYNVQELINSYMKHFQNLLWGEMVKAAVAPEVKKMQEPAYINFFDRTIGWSDFSPNKYCVYKGEDKQEDEK